MTPGGNAYSAAAELEDALESVLQILQQHLADELVAAWLHGSAFSSGLQADSDVDILAVIEQPMSAAVRVEIIEVLMRHSGYPGDGSGLRPLEVMIFRCSDLTELHYPARSELVYGEWLRETFEAGEVSEAESDPELTLVLAQARRQSLPLLGPELSELLPPISEAVVRRATGDLLPGLLAGIEGDERNVLLTLTRMWRTLEVGDFVPKDVAAHWAQVRVPAEHGELLEYARQAYLGAIQDSWKERKQMALSTACLLADRVEGVLSREVGE